VTEGDITFSSSSHEGGLVLDFDPLGAPIEVSQDPELLFSIDAFAP
jgi:hypothetical protein